jgi:simple sugar transport system permease protein
MTFDDLHIGSILVSTVRNAPVLIFAGMAGLFAERSGVIDIGLEGKILASAFVSAAVAFTTQNPWYGVMAGMLVSVLLASLQAYVAISQKGNQLVAGIAINIAMSGLTFVVAQYIFQQGGRTPDLGSARLFDVVLPGSAAVENIPFIGWLYAHLIGGHSVLVYVAFLLVPLVHWIVYHSRFGLRLRACGENPHAADAAGVSVERQRTVLAVGCLPGDRAERLLPARHVRRRRLSGTDRDGVW